MRMDTENALPLNGYPEHEMLPLSRSSLVQDPIGEGSQPSALLDEEHDKESSEDNAPGPARIKQRPSIFRSLIWEILCFVLATTSLVALVAILWSCNKKVIPNWSLGHTAITLNSIVSILSTIFRSSLLVPVASGIGQSCWTWYVRARPLSDLCYYDSASRGPLGSLRLLVRLRFM
jgi:Protein of unknown function (DUF3176)